MSLPAQPRWLSARESPQRASLFPCAVFIASAAAGVALSAAIARGEPIVGTAVVGVSWDQLLRLALWTMTWVVAVAAAMRLPRRMALALVLGAALAARLAALAGPPTTSDDLNRYAWDGRVQLSGINPYAYPPDAPQVSALREAWLWPDAAACAAMHYPADCTRINRVTVRTIYPPAAQTWFALVYRLGGIGSRHKAWQVAGLVTEFATVGLIVVALRRWRRDERWVALYALCPVPILEIVNNGHVDGLAVAFIVAAIAVAAPGTGAEKRAWADRSFLGRAGLGRAGRDVSVGLLLGAAALTKLYPALLLVAVVGVRAARPWLSVARATTAAAALAVIAYLPHVAAAGLRVVGYLPGYLHEEHYDQGGRFLLVGSIGLPGSLTTALAGVSLAGAVGWVLWRRPRFPEGAAVLLGALFLIVTPVQPWYAVSLLAVGTLTTSPWWAAVVVAGYPYFFALAFFHGHAVGLGRASFGAALVALLAAKWMGFADRLGQPRTQRHGRAAGSQELAVSLRAVDGADSGA